MSTEPNREYAAWFEPLVMTILIAIVLVVVGLHLKSQVRDVQRRIATLEQRCK